MTLLRSTLEVLRQRLDAVFQVADPRSEEWVALTSPVDLDGRITERARNKVVMALAGLQSEKTPGGHAAPVMVGDHFTMQPAPLYLNPAVLFVANFGDGNYATGLDMLSRIIGFFQENPALTAAQLPGLAEGVDRLAFDFVSLDLVQTNYLLGMLGLRYLPCALYRIRTLSFVGSAYTGATPSVRAASPDLLKNPGLPAG